MSPAYQRILVWSARVIAGLMAALILAIFIGEAAADGLGPLSDLTLRELLMAAAFLAAFLGLILGWFWTALGGWLVVGGLAAFYLIDFLFSGSFPRGATFLLIALPGLLWVISAYTSPSRNKTS